MSDMGEPTPVDLAQAIDQTIDAAGAALVTGDLPGALSFIVAAGETSDSLLTALGAPEVE